VILPRQYFTSIDLTSHASELLQLLYRSIYIDQHALLQKGLHSGECFENLHKGICTALLYLLSSSHQYPKTIFHIQKTRVLQDTYFFAVQMVGVYATYFSHLIQLFGVQLIFLPIYMLFHLALRSCYSMPLFPKIAEEIPICLKTIL